MSFIIAVIASLITMAYAVNKIISYRRLRQFKGPFWCSVSGLWLAKATLDAAVNVKTEEVIRKYGIYSNENFMRLQPDNIPVKETLRALVPICFSPMILF